MRKPVLLSGREYDVVDYERKSGCRAVCLGRSDFFSRNICIFKDLSD